jgi:hypothetical protein
MADSSLPEPAPGAPEPRWALIRDLAEFAVKAGLEALRDLVLIPVVLIAGAAGLLLRPDAPAAYFEQVLRAGRRFDAWLSLFGEDDDAPEAGGESGRRARRGVDALLERVEAVLVEEHRRGGVTTHAKTAIDRALDALQGPSARSGSRGEERSDPDAG